MINLNSSVARELAEHGRSEQCPILDMHCHMFPYYGAFMPADTPEKMLHFMDRSNVKLAVFSSHSALNEGRDFIRGDVEVARKYPGRFLCYYPVLSKVLDTENDLRELDSNPEYIGLKLLCDYYGVAMSDDRHTPFFEYADARRLPVLFHTWGHSKLNGCEELEKVCRKYRNMTVVVGHSLYGQIPEAVRLAREYPNIMLEMTALLPWRGNVEHILDAGMSDRIVFGVDNPWFSYDAYTGSLISTGIGDDELKNILYRNAARVLKRAGVTLPQYPED